MKEGNRNTKGLIINPVGLLVNFLCGSIFYVCMRMREVGEMRKEERGLRIPVAGYKLQVKKISTGTQAPGTTYGSL